ncbi:hypothetical protein [Limnoraphis robusta]|uniref:Uncharacterized protein n=1 Tax=Limnoraphis robusta CCNP1315 TaxID=3110306 RepID=A0ABU5U740_9CYAN|nr:hypothetical protein [Limnoraphis robusta]MEA5498016.1 hypothetical protein [Limnoraphis robusta BA-68 BA1]MEA5522865.1 hypothetical protein [Limnoraphis robusta CCNP1315]MEA5546873.1 hypothetical protein [Limnoraphis robusta CCNP1324]
MIVNISGFSCEIYEQSNGYWNATVYTHENSNFIISSFGANSWNEAMQGYREVIQEQLSHFNSSISPGYDWNYEVRIGNDETEEF